ncbi:MAG: hypothetical protein AAGH19_04680 [Pseudomonadota bacterium]
MIGSTLFFGLTALALVGVVGWSYRYEIAIWVSDLVSQQPEEESGHDQEKH